MYRQTQASSAAAMTRRATYGARRLARIRQRAKQNVAGSASAVVVVLIVLAAVFAPLLTPYDAYQFGSGPRLSAPSLDNWLGTDNLGRDLLSRLLLGTRIAVMVSVVSIGIGVGVGTLLGLASGWFGGMVDKVLQRFIDAMMAIPALVLAMALVAVLGAGLDKVLIAIASFMVPTAARVVRGSVLSTKEEIYIEAARSIGASSLRIVSRHILPNILAPIIIVATVQVGAVIIVEASLSFVGLGIQPPTISWGQMLSQARDYMEAAPWLVFFPTAAISVTVLAFNFFGDMLRDTWDPRLRGR